MALSIWKTNKFIKRVTTDNKGYTASSPFLNIQAEKLITWVGEEAKQAL